MLRIGIIGSGFGSYGLLPAFHGIRGARVVALAGSSRPQTLLECKKAGVRNVYADWKEMLQKESLDAVALAVTPRAQENIALEAIEKGLHVFAEKPLATSVSAASKLLRMAKKKRIVHGVDFMFPEIAAWKKVKEMLDEKAYGKLKHITVSWQFLSYDIRSKVRGWKTEEVEGGGALSFFFSHDLHAVEHFASEIQTVQGVLRSSPESLGGAEVAAELLFKCKEGITGTAHVCCNCPDTPHHRFTFVCKDATIILENEGDSVVDDFTVTIKRGGRSNMMKILPDKGLPGEGPRVKIVRKLAKRFVECCKNKKPMHPSFAHGLRVQKLIDLIKKNALRA